MIKNSNYKQHLNTLFNATNGHNTRIFLLLFFPFFGLIGCSSTPNYAPVKPTLKSQHHIYKYYIVKKGDTLYSIGQRSGHGYKTLSLWNNITPPYRLSEGQRVNLYQPQKQPTQPKQEKKEKKQEKKKIHKNLQKKKLIPSKNRPPSQKAVKVERGSSQKKTTSLKQKKNLLKLQWKWPINGKIINSFSKTGGKRIDISGKTGQQVRSAASGKVVYSGSGLKGYDNLLIIKHNSIYLSAYANNRRLLVKEGQQVKGGQIIAEIGQRRNKQPSLHFEIRKHGNSVNPLHYLPKK